MSLIRLGHNMVAEESNNYEPLAAVADYKSIGNAQSKISSIGLGTSGVGGYLNIDPHKTNQRIRVYQQAIYLGINYFDTADLYGGGYAEEVLGRAVKGVREKVFIASKFKPNNNSYEGITNSVEGSLRRLHTDYIDLYQIHWPNPFIPICETMTALERLVESGKIRYIGVSNFSLGEFKEAVSCLQKESIASVQLEYNLLDRTAETDIIPYCEENNITIIAYSALNQGKLTWRKEQNDVLHNIATKYCKKTSQIILNWLVSHRSVIALTRTNSLEHLAENVLSTTFTMAENDRNLISSTFHQSPIPVSAKEIRVYGIDSRPAYRSVEEAVENKLDLIPAPEMLAENILRRNIFKPIKLVPTTDLGGEYRYDPDHYNLMGEIKKYWAWVIAYGIETYIPAYLTEEINEEIGN